MCGYSYMISDDSVLIGNRIFRTLYRQLMTHILVFSVMVFTTLRGSSFQRRTFPFLLVPELSAASAAAAHLTVSLLTLWQLVLGTDRTENSSCCVCVAVIKWRILKHCQATGLFAQPFPGNGFQQTCHNMFIINNYLEFWFPVKNGWLPTAVKQTHVCYFCTYIITYANRSLRFRICPGT
jgi:hypothetical protein